MNFVSYDEAKGYAQRNKFRTKQWWRAHTKAEGRPASVPSNPERAYAGKGWVSWREFLGPKYKPYAEASRTAKLMGVAIIAQYKYNVGLLKKRERVTKRGCGMPVCANLQYPKGWTGRFSWACYLGARDKSYTGARMWARANNVMSQKDWRARDRPIGIPYDPARSYGRTGEWSGWKKFLA